MWKALTRSRTVKSPRRLTASSPRRGGGALGASEFLATRASALESLAVYLMRRCGGAQLDELRGVLDDRERCTRPPRGRRPRDRRRSRPRWRRARERVLLRREVADRLAVHIAQNHVDRLHEGQDERVLGGVRIGEVEIGRPRGMRCSRRGARAPAPAPAHAGDIRLGAVRGPRARSCRPRSSAAAPSGARSSPGRGAAGCGSAGRCLDVRRGDGHTAAGTDVDEPAVLGRRAASRRPAGGAEVCDSAVSVGSCASTRDSPASMCSSTWSARERQPRGPCRARSVRARRGIDRSCRSTYVSGTTTASSHRNRPADHPTTRPHRMPSGEARNPIRAAAPTSPVGRRRRRCAGGPALGARPRAASPRRRRRAAGRRHRARSNDGRPGGAPGPRGRRPRAPRPRAGAAFDLGDVLRPRRRTPTAAAAPPDPSSVRRRRCSSPSTCRSSRRRRDLRAQHARAGDRGARQGRPGARPRSDSS